MGHRIIEINNQSVVAVPHEKIVNLLATSVGEVRSLSSLHKLSLPSLKSMQALNLSTNLTKWPSVNYTVMFFFLQTLNHFNIIFA